MLRTVEEIREYLSSLDLRAVRLEEQKPLQEPEDIEVSLITKLNRLRILSNQLRALHLSSKVHANLHLSINPFTPLVISLPSLDISVDPDENLYRHVVIQHNDKIFYPYEAMSGNFGIKTDVYMFAQLAGDYLENEKTHASLTKMLIRMMGEYHNRPSSNEMVQYFYFLNAYHKPMDKNRESMEEYLENNLKYSALLFVISDGFTNELINYSMPARTARLIHALNKINLFSLEIFKLFKIRGFELKLGELCDKQLVDECLVKKLISMPNYNLHEFINMPADRAETHLLEKFTDILSVKNLITLLKFHRDNKLPFNLDFIAKMQTTFTLDQKHTIAKLAVVCTLDQVNEEAELQMVSHTIQKAINALVPKTSGKSAFFQKSPSPDIQADVKDIIEQKLIDLARSKAPAELERPKGPQAK